MNCLIVDARNEGRARILAEYLQSEGHQVLRHEPQLDVAPGAHLPPPAWVELTQNKDAVFLHVGDYQRNAPLFFAYALSFPVFCYTGTAAPAEIAHQCGTPGIHVLCPVPVGGDVDSGHRLVAVVARWLACIAGRSDDGRFVEGWQRVRDLDVDKENSLETLESELCHILRHCSWTPEQPMTEQLRDLLRTLKDTRIAWGI